MCDKHDDPTQHDASEPERDDFTVLADTVHDVLIYVDGCNHAKFIPSECSTVARRLWDAGVRMAQ